MTAARDIVIVGGGATGLVVAADLARAGLGPRIVILESAGQLGGQYSSRHVEGFGIADYGMHLIYATGRPDVDGLLLDLVPKTEVELRWGNEKDVAGLYWQGRLHAGSPFPDLRNRSDSAILEASVEGAIRRNDMHPGSAAHVLRGQFGEAVLDNIHRPILQKLHHAEPEELDPFVLQLTEMRRVVLYDEAQTLARMADPAFRSRVAFPDQLSLPAEFRPHPVFALYPKKFGMSHWIAGVRDGLLALGVEIRLGSAVAALERRGDVVTAVEVRSKTEASRLEHPAHVLWTIGDQGLLRACRSAAPLPPFEPGHRTAYVWLGCRQQPKFNDLYYAYCYDAGFKTFRVTNTSAFCPAAKSNGDWPVCVELWDREDLNTADPIAVAVEELSRMGIINDRRDIQRAGCFLGPQVGTWTTRTMAALAEVHEVVGALGMANVSSVGIAPQQGRFFFPDIITHAIDTSRAALGVDLRY